MVPDSPIFTLSLFYHVCYVWRWGCRIGGRVVPFGHSSAVPGSDAAASPLLTASPVCMPQHVFNVDGHRLCLGTRSPARLCMAGQGACGVLPSMVYTHCSGSATHPTTRLPACIPTFHLATSFFYSRSLNTKSIHQKSPSNPLPYPVACK